MRRAILSSTFCWLGLVAVSVADEQVPTAMANKEAFVEYFSDRNNQIAALAALDLFHQLRISGAPLGYESSDEFKNGLADTKRTLLYERQFHETIQIFDEAVSDQQFENWIMQFEQAYETNSSTYESFLKSKGIEPRSEAAEQISKGLILLGSVGNSRNIGDWPTYIYPFCRTQ